MCLGHYKYKIFGLTIQSDLELANLEQYLFTTLPDIDIKFGSIQDKIPNGARIGQYSQISNETYLLDIPDIVKFCVHVGTLVIIEKKNNTTSNYMLQAYLFGMIFTNILQYRGYLVLHGSAVKIGDKAIIFSGKSGAGKSTLAAAFMQRGYIMLTDDLVVLSANNNGTLSLIPGPPKFKLLQDAIDKLGVSSTDITKIEHKVDKYEIPVIRDDHVENVQVGAFYELNSHTNNNIQIQKSNGINKLELLSGNTFCYDMLKPMGKLSEHFKLCAILGKQINVFKVHRPSNTYAINELVDSIINSVTSNIS